MRERGLIGPRSSVPVAVGSLAALTSPEAERFFSRVGPVSFTGGADTRLDFAALNRDLDLIEERLCLGIT